MGYRRGGSGRGGGLEAEPDQLHGPGRGEDAGVPERFAVRLPLPRVQPGEPDLRRHGGSRPESLLVPVLQALMSLSPRWTTTPGPMMASGGATSAPAS